MHVLIQSFHPDTLRDARNFLPSPILRGVVTRLPAFVLLDALINLLPLLLDGLMDVCHHLLGDQHRGKLEYALLHKDVEVRGLFQDIL